MLAAQAIAAAVDRLRARTTYFPASVIWTVPPIDGGAGVTPGIVASGIADIKRYLFQKALDDGAPRLLIDLAGVGIVGGAAASISPARPKRCTL